MNFTTLVTIFLTAATASALAIDSNIEVGQHLDKRATCIECPGGGTACCKGAGSGGYVPTCASMFY
ncbi:hypothetical protein COCCADRAFT_8865 [Bipolaris zeicola 26-R-13]|uniref:Uncharacterized protein n=1 Tax=Cochliobolus carbonum (strain 26-R-13) TaxID=930089 RepID=W6XND0_COCC2|nr:uncharacterized protein COCCADRAFT_8865 [Bipolaris zeicola 26-R-13]EUC28837.1 hypothetical protein COCCADRAFT_8865 [Bipolaris zeicola 26-R-13]